MGVLTRSAVLPAFLLFLSLPSTGRADALVQDNVRPRDALAALLLRIGVEKSSTFRQLVEELDRSNVIVYVDVRQDPHRAPDGGCLEYIGQGAGIRWVRASIDAGTSSLAIAQQHIYSLTATLAHELQHARELSGAPAIEDAKDFDTFFRTIGVIVGPNIVDTDAARKVGRVVELELRGFAPPRR